MNYTNTYRLHAALYADSDVDKSKTFQAWQNRVQAVRHAILVIKKEHKEHISELSQKYLPREVDRLAAEAWEPARIAIRERVKELEADLQDVVDGKTQQFKKIALTAPNEEQVRLLTVLSLRDSVSEDEIERIAESMTDNYQSLLALRSIALKSNISMPEPPGVAEFEDSMSRATEFCHEMLNLIDVPNEEMGYNGRCFFDHTDVGLPKILFDRLDSCLFASVQLEPVEDGVNSPAEAS